MYGYKDVYFNKKHDNFRNSVWIELIGFDNTSPDYGVDDLLTKMGFVPDMISLHVTSIAFALKHEGMDHEYYLPKYACSYYGHDGNDDRKRQNWTNYEMKALVNTLQSRGIKVFASLFDFDPIEKDPNVKHFVHAHPELCACIDDGARTNFIHMINDFDDGTEFKDHFIPKLKKFITDFELDGIQIADGLSSPRLSLQFGDYSDTTINKFTKEYSITLPHFDDRKELARYIFLTYRKQWIEYYRKHWSDFMDCVIKAIHEVGAEADFNSAWTRGPIEALYRYGADYKSFVDSGADSFIVEDVAADIFFVEGNEMDHNRRKFIHYEFASNMLQLKAHLPNIKLTPLCMIRDTLEQWDVIHHMPTAMQRAVAVNLNNYYVNENGKLIPTTNGPHYCLGDGLKATDWDLLRLMWDNAYTENPTDVKGVTVVWSDKKCEKEFQALVDSRLWYNGKWTAELLSRGAAVHKITRIENLPAVKGPILVINPALLDDDELEMINNYNGGEVLTLGLTKNNTIEFSAFEGRSLAVEKLTDVIDPCDATWTVSLTFPELDSEFINDVAKYINELCELPTMKNDFGACHVNEVITSPSTSRLFIDNEEYWYAVPVVTTSRKIKAVKFVNKPDCYPIDRPNEYSFRLRIPGFGMDIVEITYED